jgi:hypothetical protein
VAIGERSRYGSAVALAERAIHAEEVSRMREMHMRAIPIGSCPMLGAEEP